MQLKGWNILFFIMIFCISKGYSQNVDSSIVSFYIEHFTKHTTSEGKVKFSTFPKNSIINSICYDTNCYQLQNLQDTFYLTHVDSIYGYNTRLDSIKIYIVHVNLIKKTDSSFIFIYSGNSNTYFTEKEKYYLCITPFFEQKLPHIYHGICIPIVYKNIYIPKFPIGRIGDFYICDKMIPLNILNTNNN